MKRFLGGCAMLVALAVACDSDGPTQPSITPQAPPTSVAPTPPPSATPAAPAGDATSRNAKDSYDWRFVRNDGEKVVMEATNNTDDNHDVWLTCYEGLATKPAEQTLFDTERHSIGAGSTATFECDVACGPGQVDLHEGTPPEPPVGWSRRLIVGRPTDGSGDRCTPPPPPPTCDPVELRLDAGKECGELGFELNLQACTFECNPPPVCDLEELRTSAQDKCGELGFELDPEACDFECKPPPPTCEELNPPSASGFTSNVSFSFITSSYTARNQGGWTLALYAGTPNNPRQFRKAFDGEELECDESEKLSISYRHRGHNSCLWTVVASGPTIDVNQVVLNRCEDN